MYADETNAKKGPCQAGAKNGVFETQRQLEGINSKVLPKAEAQRRLAKITNRMKSLISFIKSFLGQMQVAFGLSEK